MKEWKPRIGLVPVTFKLFWGLYPELKTKTENSLQTITKKLKEQVDVYSSGLIGDRKEADRAGKLLAKENIDLVVIWESGYVTSNIPMQLLHHLENVPVLLFVTQRDSGIPEGMNYVRYMENCALTGLVELGGILTKIGNKFITVVGHNDEDKGYKMVADFAHTAMVKSQLEELNIAVVGHVFPGMLDITVDESSLNKLGPKVTHITLPEIERRVKSIERTRVDNFLKCAKQDFDDSHIKKEDLFRAARFYIVLEDLVKDFDVDAFSLLCQDFVDVAADAPPCFALSMIQKRLGVVSGCEGDLGNTIGAFILRKITGKSVMFADWTMFDEKENAVMFQHCGIADPDITTSPVLKPHSEQFGFSGEGVAFEVVGKPGAVTMVSLIYGKDGWRIFSSEGNSLKLKPRPCGLNQMFVKVSSPVRSYLEKICNMGLPHHLNIGYGHVSKKIKYLAKLLDIEYLEI